MSLLPVIAVAITLRNKHASNAMNIVLDIKLIDVTVCLFEDNYGKNANEKEAFGKKYSYFQI